MFNMTRVLKRITVFCRTNKHCITHHKTPTCISKADNITEHISLNKSWNMNTDPSATYMDPSFITATSVGWQKCRVSRPGSNRRPSTSDGEAPVLAANFITFRTTTINRVTYLYFHSVICPEVI